MRLLERLTGMVWWPRNRDPWIKGPQPRLITVEQAEAMKPYRKEMECEKEEVSREVAR